MGCLIICATTFALPWKLRLTRRIVGSRNGSACSCAPYLQFTFEERIAVHHVRTLEDGWKHVWPFGLCNAHFRWDHLREIGICKLVLSGLQLRLLYQVRKLLLVDVKTFINLLETLFYLFMSHCAAFIYIYAQVEFEHICVQFLLTMEVQEAAEQRIYRPASL